MNFFRVATYFALAVILAVILLISGCSTKPLKPGKARFTASTPAAGAVLETTQSENPQSTTTQDYEKTRETELPIPAGSVIEEHRTTVEVSGQTNTVRKSITTATPTVQKVKETERTKSSIGPAQKDTAREIGAQLKSLAPVRWVGIVLVLGALAMFHPAVRVFIGSQTLQVATGATGLALIFLPTIVAGNQTLIILLCVGGLALWYFVHRHAEHATKAKVYKDFIDENKNGIDDRNEKGNA